MDTDTMTLSVCERASTGKATFLSSALLRARAGCHSSSSGAGQRVCASWLRTRTAAGAGERLLLYGSSVLSSRFGAGTVCCAWRVRSAASQLLLRWNALML
jgi:hypothetical protein